MIARDTLANFLSDGIREVVRHTVLGAGRQQDRLIDEDRLFSNLLSSQPLFSTSSASSRATSTSRRESSDSSRPSASRARRRARAREPLRLEVPTRNAGGRALLLAFESAKLARVDSREYLRVAATAAIQRRAPVLPHQLRRPAP